MEDLFDSDNVEINLNSDSNSININSINIELLLESNDDKIDLTQILRDK